MNFTCAGDGARMLHNIQHSTYGIRVNAIPTMLRRVARMPVVRGPDIMHHIITGSMLRIRTGRA